MAWIILMVVVGLVADEFKLIQKTLDTVNMNFCFILLTGFFSTIGSTPDNGYVELDYRIFGFQEATKGCERAPQTPKEKQIGKNFQLLCKHFGPVARDEIINATTLEKLPEVKSKEKLFLHLLNKIKPNIIDCWEIVFDAYDLAGLDYPPKCLKNIAIYPDKPYQIFWLQKFHLVVQFVETAIEGYKEFNPARKVAEKFLEQGLLDSWSKLKDYHWAQDKVKLWRASKTQDKLKKMFEILKKPPNILTICKFAHEWLENPRDFESNECLRTIIANILILETFMQSQSLTLELEFMEEKIFLLHLLHVIKSVIRQSNKKGPLLRKSLAHVDVATVAEIHEIRAANVKCLDELRSMADKKSEKKVSQLLTDKKIQECLDTFVDKTDKANEMVKSAYISQLNTPEKKDVKKAEKILIKSLMQSHKKMKHMQPVIDDMVRKGIPKPSPKYPWAQKFLSEYDKLTIPNDYAKLERSYHVSRSYSSSSSSSSCKRKSKVAKNRCYSKYVAENMIVENELQKKGMSLQYVYLGDPFKMNTIYYINQSLKKQENNKGRVMAQYRIALDPVAEINGTILDEVIEKSQKLPETFTKTIAGNNSETNGLELRCGLLSAIVGIKSSLFGLGGGVFLPKFVPESPRPVAQYNVGDHVVTNINNAHTSYPQKPDPAPMTIIQMPIIQSTPPMQVQPVAGSQQTTLVMQESKAKGFDANQNKLLDLNQFKGLETNQNKT